MKVGIPTATSLPEFSANFQPSKWSSSTEKIPSCATKSNGPPPHASRFATKSFKFGKIDVSRSPKVAQKYNIASSVTSRTLPALLMFKDGHECLRRPLVDQRGRVVPFSFSYVSRGGQNRKCLWMELTRY